MFCRLREWIYLGQCLGKNVKNSSLVFHPPPLLFLFLENIFSILFTIKLDEKVSKIEIQPLWHRGKNQVGIYFKYDELHACKQQGHKSDPKSVGHQFEQDGGTNKPGKPKVQNVKRFVNPGKFTGISVNLVLDITSYLQV